MHRIIQQQHSIGLIGLMTCGIVLLLSIQANAQENSSEILTAPPVETEVDSTEEEVSEPDETIAARDLDAEEDAPDAALAEPPSEESNTATVAELAEPVAAEPAREPFIPDGRPYARGDMELSLGLGFAGYDDAFSLGIGAGFAYYVFHRFAPGLDINYTAIWGDLKYPQSFTLFPYLKFVLIRSHKVAPYLLVGGGREFEWGGASESFNARGEFVGYSPVHVWLFGVGGGVHIAAGSRMYMEIRVLAMYAAYDETVYYNSKNIDSRWYPAPRIALGFRF